MGVLSTKLRRELLQSRATLGSIVAILMLGVTCFVGLLGTYHNLSEELTDYYARCRMADAWVELKKAPLRALDFIGQVDGVADYRARVQFQATVDLPDTERTINGLVLSMPEEHQPVINDAILQTGSWFSGGKRNEVIVSDKFAAAHDLSTGAQIALIIDGKRREFRVIGTALSSEFVYMTPPGAFAPDAAGYGWFLVAQPLAEDLFDFQGACNSIAVALSPDRTRSDEAILQDIRGPLEQFGVFAAYPRADQNSNLTLTAEIAGLGTMAMFLPVIFFGVAALILNVLLARTVQRDRVIIGTFKALGLRDRELLLHFVEYGTLIALIGGILGCALGLTVSGAMTRMYSGLFDFPRLVNHVYPGTMLLAIGIGIGFGTLGAWRGARGVLRLSPAAAMRPSPPVLGGKVWLERLPVIWSRLGCSGKLVFRNLLRHRLRTAVGVLAGALGASLVAAGFGLSDCIDEMMEFQFDKVLLSDNSLGLRNQRGDDALREVRRLPGVIEAESQLVVPCTFYSGRRTKRGAITGVVRGARMTVPRDSEGRAVAIPADGLLMSQRLARQLAVGIGDSLWFQAVEGEQRRVEVPVSQIIESRLGLAVYADFESLGRWIGDPGARSHLQVTTAFGDGERAAFLAETKRRPGIEAVSVTDADRVRMEEEFIKSMHAFTIVIIAFAGVIFFGSVLNASLIALAERRRQVATFLALGWRSKQVSGTFLAESMIVHLLGILPGLWLGYEMIRGMAVGFENDMFSMTPVIRGRSYVWTVLLCPVFVVLAHLFVRRAIRRSDWLRDLGARE